MVRRRPVASCFWTPLVRVVHMALQRQSHPLQEPSSRFSCLEAWKLRATLTGSGWCRLRHRARRMQNASFPPFRTCAPRSWQHFGLRRWLDRPTVCCVRRGTAPRTAGHRLDGRAVDAVGLAWTAAALGSRGLENVLSPCASEVPSNAMQETRRKPRGPVGDDEAQWMDDDEPTTRPPLRLLRRSKVITCDSRHWRLSNFTFYSMGSGWTGQHHSEQCTYFKSVSCVAS